MKNEEQSARRADPAFFAQLQLAVENSMDGIALLNAAGEYTYLNPRHITMFGYEKEEELLGKTWEAIYGSAERERIATRLFPLLMASGYWSGETTGISKTGSPVYQHIALTALPDGGLICITKDTTHQKRREEEMQLMMRMMQKTTSMVVVVNENREVEWVNEAFLKRTGFTEEEVNGKRPDLVLRGNLTDTDTLRYMQSQLDKGDGFETEVLNYTKSGEPYWVFLIGMTIKNDEGKPYRFCFFAEDITKRKQAEERLKKTEDLMQAAVEGIEAGVYEWDLETGQVQYSDTAYRLLGYIQPMFAAGQKFTDKGIHPDDAAMVQNNLDELIHQGKRLSVIYRIRKGNGEYTWINDHAKPVEWKNGKPVRIVGSFQDITHIKNYEKELIRRKQEINFALEASSAAIWEWDIITDEGRFSQELGLIMESNDFEGKRKEKWEPRIHPEDRDHVNMAMADYLTGKKPRFEVDYRAQTGRGDYIWLRSQGKIIEWDKDKQPLRVVGTVMDITARQNEKEKLSESEQRWQFALDSTFSGVWDWNMIAGEVYYSAGWKTLLGIGQKEISMDLREWKNRVHPEDLPFALQRLQMYSEGYAPYYESEHRMICENGKIKWVLDRGKIISYTPEGKPMRMIGSFTDISIRKQAEEELMQLQQRWQFALEGSETGVWDWERDTGYIYMSDSWKSILGYAPDEIDSSRAAWESLIHPDDRAMAGETVEGYLSGQLEHFELVYRLRRRDGNYSWTQSRGKAIEFREDGSPRRIIGIQRNIDHFIEIQQSLREAKDAAEISAVIKQRFLANITHELRTPMQAILGMGEQLSETELDEKQTRLVSIINQSSNILLGIINDLLDITKIEEGKLKLFRRPFALLPALHTVYQVLSLRAEEKGLSLRLITDPALEDCRIEGDELRLKQILLNIAGNAVKFTPDGQVELQVRLLQQDEVFTEFECICTDTGIGISEEMQERLFEEFVQEDDSFVRRFGGSGLGLSITRKLVEMMDGTITVKSEKNRGTTVCCRFRFQKAMPGVSATEEIQPSVEPQSFLSGRRVLLADDNRFNRLLAIFILEKFGMEYDEAEDGNQAIALLKEKPYDLILMDIQMPEKDGFEATREIREVLKLQTPVLVLTAHGFQENIIQMKELGATDAIIKPFDEKSFVAKMLEILKPER